MASNLSELIKNQWQALLPEETQFLQVTCLSHAHPDQLRQHIRNSIFEFFRGKSSNIEQVLNLEVTPRILNKQWISISHKNHQGIWICSPKICGVDLEDEQDFIDKARVVNRVCQPHEFSQAPSAISLWTAKESAFKAATSARNGNPQAPTLLSQIEISAWKSSELSSDFCFNWKSAAFQLYGCGAVTSSNGMCFAISFI